MVNALERNLCGDFSANPNLCWMLFDGDCSGGYRREGLNTQSLAQALRRGDADAKTPSRIRTGAIRA